MRLCNGCGCREESSEPAACPYCKQAMETLPGFSREDKKISWPKRYRQLPAGYSVWWMDAVEHYMGFGPNDTESPIFANRHWARLWCFAQVEQQKVA